MWKTKLKNHINSLKEQINELYKEASSAPVEAKEDGSPVTVIDLFISEQLQNFSEANLSDHVYFGEEFHTELNYPAFIVDPIDGTRGLLDGTLESSISIGVAESSDFTEEDFGLIFNPFNGYYIDSEMIEKSALNKPAVMLKGMVSRTEYSEGLYSDIDSEQVFILPMGSIAYKLGLLAGGMIDFVITKKPKNIWDIAGGSILCHQAGYKCFDLEGEVKQLVKLHDGPLLWCREADRDKILKELKLV